MSKKLSYTDACMAEEALSSYLDDLGNFLDILNSSETIEQAKESVSNRIQATNTALLEIKALIDEYNQEIDSFDD